MPLDPETAQEFGELTEAVRGLNRIVEHKFAEFMRLIGDQNAQFHEIKHDVAGQQQITTILNERFSSHLVKQDRDNTMLMDAVKENRATSQEASREMGDRINRDLVAQSATLGASIAEIKAEQVVTTSQLTELLTLKHTVLGGLAVIGILIGFFGSWFLKLIQTAWAALMHP